MQYSSLIFNDAQGNERAVRIDAPGAGKAELDALGHTEIAQNHINGGYIGCKVYHDYDSPKTPVDTGKKYLVTQKAIMSFADANGRSVKLDLVTPKDSVITVDGKNELITSVCGNSIAAAMSTATGKTLTFLSGKMWQKPVRR